MTSGAVPRARVAAMVAFGCQGFVFISTTTRLPLLSERWDLGALALSGLLLMVVLLAGVGSVLRLGFAVPSLLILLVWPLARHFETPVRTAAQAGTSAQ